MHRLHVRYTCPKTGAHRSSFVVGTLHELHALVALPEYVVIPDPYNPPGFPQGGRVDVAALI